MRRTTTLIAVMALFLACSRAPEPTPTDQRSQGESADPAASLAELVESYYERYLELTPLDATFAGDMRFNDRLPNDLSETWLADALALEQEYLARADAIDSGLLDTDARVTWEAFRYGREQAVRGFSFPQELLPVSQFFSLPAIMAQLGAGSSAQPFATTRDYENWLARLDGLVVWMDQAIANMRVGIDKGIVQPRVVVERTLPQLSALIVEDPTESIFFTPVTRFPEAVPAPDRERLAAAYRDAIAGKLTPAYRRLHDFLRDEYLPAARDSVGYSSLPNGPAWYADRVAFWTTTDLEPARIHRIGLDEVARIRNAMDEVRTSVGFEGDLPAFFEHLRTDPRFQYGEPEELLDAYRSLKERVEAAAPALFSLMPHTDFEVRAVEAFREQSQAAASYQPGAPDGSRPGIFYVNTYDLPSRRSYFVESTFLHEAIPGHHFQIALQRERDGLPRFRRFGGYGAYIEGWGLYAESLGPALGLYQDPYQYFGALTGEILRAIRLVVDTGLHQQGWTREQAIEYMRENSALGEQDIVAEVERYIAVPGQALAYTIGALKFRELRARAEQSLGPDFDVREFHAELLKDGSLPLGVLEAKVDRWIETHRH